MSLERLSAPFYGLARLVLGAGARVYFRSIEVRHRERVPRRGPLLIVANHPASFTDVIVLALAIPRRLHFLAMAPIFKPWIRGFALRLCGTLPVYRRQDDPAELHRNDDTFRACHAFLDRGGAVLIFPEGTSLTDRQVVKLKTGAARIALGQEARPGQEGRLTLLPVGLHFAERTGFWTDVVASVGRPVDLAPFRAMAAEDPAAAVRALTDRLQTAIEKLILNLVEDRVALVHAIEDIYREEVIPGAGVGPLGVARGMAECIEYFARTDPARVEAAALRVGRYREWLAALRIRDQTVREMLPAEGRKRERARLLTLGLLGILPALAGGAIHYLPYRASGAGGRATRDPTRVAGYRLGIAFVAFPFTYAAFVVVMRQALHWEWPRVLLVLAIAAALGMHALFYFNWLSRQWKRVRLVFLKARNRREVARLRRERRELIRMCDQAVRDHAAARERAAKG